jgi:hypothetical protein
MLGLHVGTLREKRMDLWRVATIPNGVASEAGEEASLTEDTETWKVKNKSFNTKIHFSDEIVLIR